LKEYVKEFESVEWECCVWCGDL